jgi:redox-sensing transcriptional repressor
LPPAETHLSSLPTAAHVPPLGAAGVLGHVADGLPVPGPGKPIPAATVTRLPVYLRALNQLAGSGTDTVSSGALAEAAGVSPAQLRKDLSSLGSYGTRGVGYDVDYLRRQIGREVGSAHEWPVVIVGLGNLGTALANYSGFSSRGFRIVAMVDPNPALIGRRVNGVPISDLADLETVLARTGAVIAVIATPAEAAQAVADRLVYQGVTSILNFAATVLVVPDGVTVRKVDLGQELQILAYHEQRKSEEIPEPASARVGEAVR